jgi:RNA-binding protein
MKESEKAWLRGRGQLLEPLLRLGRQGVTPEFVTELNRLIDANELVKVKFVEFKEERKTLAPKIAEQSNSELIGLVGHTALYYRQQPDATKRHYHPEERREKTTGEA